MFNNYDIKYIIKRIIIGVGIILFLSFINKCDVHAVRTDGTIYSAPPNATFYANPSLNSHTPLPGGFNTSIWSSAVINGLGGTSDVYGADVCMGLDSTLKGNYLYSVSIVLNNYNNSAYTVASGGDYAMLRGGYNFGQAINNANSMTIYYFGTVPTSTITGLGSNYSNSTILNYMFVPKAQFNYICLPFKTVNQTSVVHNLLGYYIEVIGDTNGLSSSDIQSAVSSSLSSTNNKIDGLYTSMSGVEKNLSNQIQTTRSELNTKMTQINDTINDDDVSGANSQVDSLLENDAFNDNTGIQSIINAPLNFINGLSNSCYPIQLTIPYIDSNVSIPCIKQELTNRVPTIVPILSTAINGFIIYRILIDIVYLIKSARNPDDDRIEVLDL